MSLVWMPVETGDKPIESPTRLGMLRHAIDAAGDAITRVARWFSGKLR